MKPVPRSRVVLAVVLLAAAVVPMSLVLAEAPPPPPPTEAPVAVAPAPPAQPADQVEPAPKPQKAPRAEPAPKPEKVMKAEQAGRADVPPPPPPAIKVALHGEAVTVNGEGVPAAALADVLRKHAQVKGKGVVVALDADGDVPMSALHQVQEAMRAADLHKVVYADDLNRALPLVLPPAKLKALQAKLDQRDLARVAVDPAGVITVDGDAVGGAKLPEQVRKRLAKRPDTVFLLETSAGTRYGAFTQVLAGLQDGGAKRIAVDDPKL